MGTRMTMSALRRPMNPIATPKCFLWVIILLINCHVAIAEQISGHATFTDGSPLADVRLVFKVFSGGYQVSGEGSTGVFHAKTDRNGEFKWDTDATVKGDVLVVADDYQDGDSLAWHTIIRDFDSRFSTQMNAEFENRGRIIVRVFGQTNLPEDHKIFLRCQASRYEEMIQLDREISPSDRGITFIGLDPGEYNITALVNRMGRQSWETTVTIPDSEPFRGICKVQLPVVEFGSFNARFTLPDGKTPAVGFRMWVEAADGEASGIHAVTDGQGVLQVSGIVTGRVRIRALDTPGIAPNSHWAEAIKSKQPPSLSQHRLLADDEVFSWIKGRIQYADGTPVSKVTCQGSSHILDLATTWMGELGVEGTCDENGNFNYYFEAGKMKLRFDIEGSNQRVGGLVMEPIAYRVVFVDVDTQAGETIDKTIQLPICDRNVAVKGPRVDLDGEPDSITWFGGQQNVTLLFPLEQDYCWCASKPDLGFLIRENAAETWQRSFEKVPRGDGFAIYREHGKRFDVMPFKSTEVEKIEFTQERFGSLTIQSSDGESLKEKTITLEAIVGGNKLLVVQKNGGSSELTQTAESISFAEEQIVWRGDGEAVITGLGPGRYLLTLRKNQKRIEKEFQLSQAQQAVFTLASTQFQ